MALGGKATLVGLIGRDTSASTLRDALSGSGLPTDGLVEDTHRPTTTKVRVVTDRHQQVARVDYEDDHEAAGGVETALVESASRLAAHAGAIVVSDYLKGCVTRRLVGELVVLAKQQSIHILVDPRFTHHYYRGTSLVTPDHHEAQSRPAHGSGPTRKRRLRRDDSASAPVAKAS